MTLALSWRRVRVELEMESGITTALSLQLFFQALPEMEAGESWVSKLVKG